MKSNKIVLFIVSAILGISSVLIFLLILIGTGIEEIYFHLNLPQDLITFLFTPVVLIIVWYLISRKLYSGDRKMLFLSLLVLIAVSIVSLGFFLYETSMGPKGKQIPMYALIFRGYQLDYKLIIYDGKESDWSFYEPHGYNEKYSLKYKDRIFFASFYYPDKQKAQQAFKEYRTLIILNGFNTSGFDVKINNSEVLDLIDSFALQNNDFVYSEFIETKDGYLPGYYIIVIKSNINEKQLVKTIVSHESFKNP